MKRLVELDAGLPALNPCDLAVNCLEVRNPKADRVADVDPDRRRKAAALQRHVEQIDPVARIAMALELDFAA